MHHLDSAADATLSAPRATRRRTGGRRCCSGPWLLLAAALLTLGVAAPAQGDSIKLSGFWHDDLSIETVVDGHIVYRTAGGRRSERALAEVEGLKLEAHPALATAEEAREAAEHAEAARHYRRLFERDEVEPWLAAYVRTRLVPTLDALDEPVEAMEEYVALIESGAIESYLVEPPTRSLRGADAEQRQRIGELVDSVIDDADPATRAALERLREQAARDPGEAGVEMDEGAAVVLPATIDDDAATAALRRGEFDAALEAAEQTLSTGGGLARGLYQKGLAQRARAEAEGDEALLKSAGLSFMRVIVYFPRSGYVGPALVEAGHVHAELGREDLAASLYDRARLRIDADDDPAYHQRLARLRDELRARRE